jgi:endoribonuclease Dicer
MDLFVARTIITKASLVFRGPIEITESQVDFLCNEASKFISIFLH